MKIARPFRPVLAMVVMAFQAIPSMATDAPPPALRGSLLAHAAMVSDAELSDMRGGFITAAGAQFDFGASIQTMVNGQLALQTNVNWTPAGISVQQLSGLGASIQAQVNAQVTSNLAQAGITNPATAVGTMTTSGSPTAAVTTTPVSAIASNAPIAAANTALAALPAAAVDAGASPTQVAAAASLAGTALASLTGGATPVTTPATTVAAAAVAATPAVTQAPAPQTTTVATITNVIPATGSAGTGSSPSILSGVQLQSASGNTQVLTNISAGQLQNIVVNSASNQNIAQNTNLIFTIYNFADWQKQIAQNTVSAQLAGEIMAASGLGGSR